MADSLNILPPRAFERVFVALKTALEIAGLRPSAPLARAENIWALAVLLTLRAYWWLRPNETDYRLAVQALGPLGTVKNGLFWRALADAGEAANRATLAAAFNALADQLSDLGVGFLAAAATESRLSSFRDAAARIAPIPDPLPQLDLLYPDAGPGLGPLGTSDGITTGLTQPPSQRLAAPSSTGRKILVYGTSAIGGLTLLFGVYRFMKMRKGEAHG